MFILHLIDLRGVSRHGNGAIGFHRHRIMFFVVKVTSSIEAASYCKAVSSCEAASSCEKAFT